MVNLILILPLLVTFLLFPAAAFVALRIMPARLRMPAFALVNLLGAAALCGLSGSKGVRIRFATQFIPVALFFFALYLVLVIIEYVLACKVTDGKASSTRVAFWFPILALIYIKYVPPAFNPFMGITARFGQKQLTEFFVGISYMAFRLSHMVQELRNGVIKKPGFWEFLSFAFFVPTLSIGPINPYSNFQKTVYLPDWRLTPPGRAVLRILLGATKYIFLSNLFNQLTYTGLLLDGHPHPPVDFVIAIFAYTFYMYTNFSGYCDMVIGISGLLGIHVMENFNDPFLARNLQIFWNRWHISLSTYMRDMMFSPMSKALIRRFGPQSANASIAVTIFCVFVVLGIWHGVGWNYAIFGAWQGIGLVICHYYTVYLKRKLGKKGYAAYMDNSWIAGVSTALTFTYFACGLFWFANPLPQMTAVLRAVRW